MNKTWTWVLLAGGAILLWLLVRGKGSNLTLAGNPNKTGTAGTTTGTQTAADPYWSGWGTASDTILQNTTATINGAVAGTRGIVSGVTGLFGGASTATGRAS